jgi:formylglycine-generating enzyme required for sulfatase activity
LLVVGSHRVNRGGSWNSTAKVCQSAYRDNNEPHFCHNYIGFRLAFYPGQ